MKDSLLTELYKIWVIHYRWTGVTSQEVKIWRIVAWGTEIIL
jgi:hypothetical protein